jgi:H+-transporting ATPase
MLMVIIMVTNDFLTISLTVDGVRPSPKPNWRIGSVTIAVVLLGLCEFGLFHRHAGRRHIHMSWE